jgi:hypothetical protein
MTGNKPNLGEVQEAIERTKEELQRLAHDNLFQGGVIVVSGTTLQKEHLKREVRRLRGKLRRAQGRAADMTQKRVPSSQQESGDTCNFQHSPDYRSITFAGENCTLTRNQSLVVETLHEAYLKGLPEVGKDLLLQKVESTNVRLRDTFKNSPLWRRLIVRGEKRGTYRLNLPEIGTR